MHELTNLDLVIIVLYMIGMLFVGVWFVKRIKNTGDYYIYHHRPPLCADCHCVRVHHRRQRHDGTCGHCLYHGL